jgi:hypothetical protein
LNEDAVGVLPEGTKLKISKIWFYYNFDHGDWYIPVAEILDEPYKGYQVSLEYISKDLESQGKRSKRWYLKTYEFFVEDGNPAYLKKCQ